MGQYYSCLGPVWGPAGIYIAMISSYTLLEICLAIRRHYHRTLRPETNYHQNMKPESQIVKLSVYLNGKGKLFWTDYDTFPSGISIDRHPTKWPKRIRSLVWHDV